MSPLKEKSFDRELKNYTNQGLSFKVFTKNEDKDKNGSGSGGIALQRVYFFSFEHLLRFLQENELLRKKLIEEQKLRENQENLFNSRLDEYVTAFL